MEKSIALQTTLEQIFRLTPNQKRALHKLRIHTVDDLLHHFPARYTDAAQTTTIGNLKKGDQAAIFGKIHNLKTKKAWRKKIPMAEATVTDETGNIKAVWFHQPYIAKMASEGGLVRVEGKVGERKGELFLSNPRIERIAEVPPNTGPLFGDGTNETLYPVYPESRGITSNWFYHAIVKMERSGVLDTVEDPIPDEMLKKYNLPTLKTALIWIHTPQKQSHADSARKRFAFEEVFFIQLTRLQERNEYAKNPSFKITIDQELVNEFLSRFPFTMTDAQNRAVGEIFSDFKKEHPMSRLLEGDVGSGKTAVAAVTSYAVITGNANGAKVNRLQVAIMAPTEILAQQHFENFIKYFSYANIPVTLITGSGCKKFPSKTNPLSPTPISRAQLLKWVGNGEIPILVGTHALIQKAVKFQNLAYVIIDEQHRFGVNQRKLLARKEKLAPHLLSMTATPIPRTLALTIYGDLDLTLLDEMPPGRKNVITEVVSRGEEDRVYKKIREELLAGRQAYIICPRINEPDPEKELALNTKSVKKEATRLDRDVFPDFTIAVLHGKMKPAERDSVMKEFERGEIQILVATSVIEVGVNVPNATIIVIEGAERFGLAQLHQLRGRVLRSTKQAYCFLFTSTEHKEMIPRLKALVTAKNGFELAEMDLTIRGGGELSGGRQWGISDVGMEAIKNLKMVEAARAEAQKMLNDDPELITFPTIKQRIDKEKHDIHFE
ncbi:MAG: ATP-dependent DNA helicase RecG [Candidatus Yonathbacteria bacterium]|nr:ATP-dependent DNA helicase RecG [Candidatus Yonathbacteria bacterium]